MASCKLILFSLVSVICLAGVHVEAIKCHVCNSERVGQEDCDDAFSGEDKYLTECVQDPDTVLPPFMYCRKYEQEVEGNKRIQRMCATAQEDGRDAAGCAFRSGTDEIFLTICTCDADGCNGASGVSTLPLVVLSALAGLVAMAARW